MSLANSPNTYGAVTKSFHWLTALLILSALPLGLIANDMAHAIKDPAIATDDAYVARTVLLFSLHKTIGVTVFFVALFRILWAFTQTKPGLLNGDKPLEAWAAETVHWLLYGSLLLVPLTGWIHHAATTGFAPIWWPFGQALPFVPKDDGIAHTFASLHYVLTWVLALSLGAHIAGALKHHVIDKDATLRRMLPGATSAAPSATQPGHGRAALTALVIWAAALGVGGALGLYGGKTEAEATTASADAAQKDTVAPQATAEAPKDLPENSWVVQDGTLSLTVTQLGSPIEGRFADWTANIVYSEASDDAGKHGTVTVEVTIASLTLGSVTDQAKGGDFLAASTHPTALFQADILTEGDGKVAQGTLTIKDNAVPVTLPFDLTIEGNTAKASGQMQVDRRDFNIGAADEGNVGAAVTIGFDLTATR